MKHKVAKERETTDVLCLLFGPKIRHVDAVETFYLVVPFLGDIYK